MFLSNGKVFEEVVRLLDCILYMFGLQIRIDLLIVYEFLHQRQLKF